MFCEPSIAIRVTATHSIERGDGFYSLYFTVDGDAMERRLDVSAVFMATGRTPRTANLGLEVCTGAILVEVV